MAFDSKIKSITGIDITDGTIQGYITDWLTDGVREVINSMPMPFLWAVAGETAIVADTGLDIETGKLLAVVGDTNDIPAREIPSTSRYKAKTSGWLEYATATDPAFYRYDNKVYLLPTTIAGKALHVSYPTVSYNDVSIDVFPNEFEYLVVLYASLKSLHYLLNSKNTDTVIADKFTLNAIMPDTITSSAIDSTSVGSGAQISFSESLTSYSLSALSGLQTLAAFDDPGSLTISASAPTTPDAPVIASPGMASTTLSFTATAPTYTAPTTSLSALEAFSAFSGTLANLTITATAPDNRGNPTIASLGVATIAKADMDGNVPTYTKPSTVINAIAPDAPALTSITFTSMDSTLDASSPTFTTATASAANIFVSTSKPATALTASPPSVPALATVSFTETNVLDISTTDPTTIALTTVAYTGLVADIDVADSGDITQTTVSLLVPTQPSYTSIGMGAGDLTHDLASLSVTSLTINAIAPDAPSTPDFTDITISEDTISGGSVANVTVGTSTTVGTIALAAATVHSHSAPTYNNADTHTVGDIPAIATVDYSTPGNLDVGTVTSADAVSVSGAPSTAPAYDVTLTSFFAYDSGLNETDPGSFTLNAVAPDPPTISTIEFTDLTLSTAVDVDLVTFDTDADSNDASSDNTSYGSAIDITTTTVATPVGDLVGGAVVPSYTSPTIADAGDSDDNILSLASGISAEDASQIDVETWWETLGDMIEDDEDVELAGAQVNKINSFLQAYNLALQDRLNDFNVDVAEYTFKTQKAFNDANALLQERLAEDNSRLQRISLKSAQDIGNAERKSRQDMGDKDRQLAKETSNQTRELQQEQANKDRELQKELQNSINNMQADVSDNQNKMAKFQSQLQEYQMEVQAEVQTYGQQLALYQVELSTHAQAWAQAQNHKLQESSGDFNSANALFQSQVQIALQDAQLTNQTNLQNMQKDLNKAIRDKDKDQERQIQEAIQTTQAIIADNSSIIQNYQVEESQKLQEYQLDIQNNMNEFNESNAKYQSTLQEEIQNLQIASARIEQQAQIDIQEVVRQSDIDMAQAQKNADLTLQADIANKSNDLQAKIQEKTQNLQKEIQEKVSEVSIYGQNISVYQSEVNTEVQEWQVNTNKDLQIWQQTQGFALQEHSQRMQDSLNKFNEENAEYQAEVQAELQQAQITNQENVQNMQKDLQIAIRNEDKSQEHQLQEAIQDTQAIIANNQSKITQYQAMAGHYATQVNEDIQAYTSRLQADVQTMQGKMSNNDSLIKGYASEVQGYQAEVAAEVQVIQANFQGWIQELQAAIQESIQELQVANQVNIAQAQAELQRFTSDKDREFQRQLQNGINDMQAIVADNQNKVAKYQAEFAVYQGEVSTESQVIQFNIQNELNEFNKDNVRYQANIQAEITKAQIDSQEAQKEGDMLLQASIQDYSLELQNFQGDIAKYQAEVNDQVSEYTQNLQKAIQTWTTEQGNRLTRYQAEQQDSLGEFNEKNAEYQAELQRSVQNAQLALAEADKEADLTFQATIQDYTLELQKYQADVQAYASEVNTEVQQYQINLSEKVQGWRGRQDDIVKEYQSNMQDRLNIFNQDHAEYQGALQLALENGRLKLQELSTDADLDLRAKIEKENQIIQKYASDLQGYVSEVTSEVQEYAQKLTAIKMDYEWLNDQYNKVKSDYERGMSIMMGGRLEEEKNEDQNKQRYARA